MRHLPPLTSLRPFEAAARTSSFAKAGEELCLTSAAIAHQIKSLEAFLGFQLFDRMHRGVALNKAGEIYYKTVQALLNELELSTVKLKQDNLQNPLRITALHAFAENWFMQRWPQFQALYPNTVVEITANHLQIDVAKGEADIWICHAEQAPENYESDLLMEDLVTPVCSPSLLLKNNHLADETLLKENQWIYDLFWKSDWDLWLDSAGFNTIEKDTDILGFNLYSMVVQATVKGLGVSMGHLVLIEDELASGALVAPFDCRIPSGKSFYAVYSDQALKRAEVQDFRHWLQAQISE